MNLQGSGGGENPVHNLVETKYHCEMQNTTLSVEQSGCVAVCALCTGLGKLYPGSKKGILAAMTLCFGAVSTSSSPLT